MEPMPQEDAETMFKRALEALAAGRTQTALAQLERAFRLKDDPALYSYLGYCIAKERGQVKKGLELCRASLEADSQNPAHYLNLARVQLIAGEKDDAIASLRKGVGTGGGEEIHGMLVALGIRKRPPLPFLPRANPVNKYLGLFLSRLHLR